MTNDAIIEYVSDRLRLEQPTDARTLIDQALEIFATGLTSSEARRLAREVGAPWSGVFLGPEHGQALTPEGLTEELARRCSTERNIALEQAQVVLQAVSRTLSAETRDWLSDRLGEPWRPFLELRSTPTIPPRPPAAPPVSDRPRTLAEGKAGSETPLSESAPDAQPDSVAASNPYEDRKVSSAKDVHAEPISSGDPRSKHPVSEHDDEPS